MHETRLPGSFRDPAGYVIRLNGLVHRRVEPAGLAAYRRLIDSGLYDTLTSRGLLVAHEDLGTLAEQPGAAAVLRPEQIPMVSYPYEWSLSQLRDSALVTLDAQREALRAGMVLKDASAFNVQFLRGRPILIDTLSFEPYEGGPWVAYRQFCQHFYAPLLVAASVDPRLVRATGLFIDGLPLSIASSLLPRRTWLKPGPLFHVHLHARAEARWGRTGTGGRGTGEEGKQREGGSEGEGRSEREGGSRRAGSKGEGKGESTRSVEAVIESLRRAVQGLGWSGRSHWSSYYAEGQSYSAEAFARKSEVVTGWLERLRPGTVWDLGANTGYFSKAAARLGAHAVAFDSDPACIEALYREVREQRLQGVLPLVFDLASPSPAIGWANAERMTLAERGPVDLLLALAVTHHLAVANNVPFMEIATYFSRLCRDAIVEFVPKTDPMVQRMLRAREDIFTDYTQAAFERAFAAHFEIHERVILSPSDRILYRVTAR